MSVRIVGDRYQLQQLLGRGGMADVWRAVDLRLDRPVAVKLLNASGQADPVALERLHREARAVARLDHPNIVAVHDVGVGPEGAYLVMELVEGGSLADLLARGPLPVGQAVAIAAQTCAALAAAHAAAIVHRDVKPANLLLTPAGAVKVCDFGIARLAQATSGATLTHQGTVIGTAAYMAPEQATGDPTSPRTDLYAVGCLLYTMLTGAPPFQGDNPIAVLQQHLNQPPPPLYSRRADVPAQLDSLVGELLAKNPADRPVDAATVRARLDQVTHAPATGSPAFAAGVAPLPTIALPVTTADPGGAGPGLLSWLRRTRAGRSVAAVAAAGVVAFLLLAAATSGPSGDDDAAGGGVGSTTESATTAATAGPTPAPTLRTPTDQISAIDTTMAELVDTGQLDPDSGRDLRRDLADIGKQLDRERYRQAAERVDEMRQRVDELRRDGKLDAAGYSMLVADLDALAASVPEDRSNDD